jgi:hypothetical protein
MGNTSVRQDPNSYQALMANSGTPLLSDLTDAQGNKLGNPALAVGKIVATAPLNTAMILGGPAEEESLLSAAGKAMGYGKVAARIGDLTTARNEAVFWSGIRGGDAVAAKWVSQNGGATLETTLASRGITLPAWDAANPSSVAAWREASKVFAQKASGDVRVLQTDAVRVNSVWAEVEFPALKANKQITSITSVNPDTGASTLLWTR